jgi:hypothetical protein
MIKIEKNWNHEDETKIIDNNGMTNTIIKQAKQLVVYRTWAKFAPILNSDVKDITRSYRDGENGICVPEKYACPLDWFSEDLCLASVRELDAYVQGTEINKPINHQKNYAVTLPTAGTTSILNQLHWPFGMRKVPIGHTKKLFEILQTYAPICNTLYQ